MNISVLGYALYLVIDAISLWNGVFPFFPSEFHTTRITFLYAVSQSSASFLTFFGTIFLVYHHPQFIRRMLVFTGVVPLFLGSLCLIAALYIPALDLPFVIAAGILLGVGGAGFLLDWQRYFASVEPDKGNFYLLAGTALAPVFFFVTYLIPVAIRVYLIPLIIVPLCGLCAILATRTIDFTQSLYTDIPSEHPQVYRRVIRDYWKSAIAVGALGFASGMVRAIAVGDIAFGDLTNNFSMAGSFLVAVVLLWRWRHTTFTLNINTVFLTLFPVVGVLLLIFPFVSGQATSFLAGLIYMTYSFAVVIMILQCMQVARDRGVNPAFIFGFFSAVVYLLRDAGFIFGYVSNAFQVMDQSGRFTVAFAALFVLSAALYILRGGSHANTAASLPPDRVEFMQLDQGVRKPAVQAQASPAAAPAADDGMPPVLEEPARQPQPERTDEPVSEFVPAPAQSASAGPLIHDRLSKCCMILQEQYRLTSRETEVMEMILRGNSVSSIAQQLFVSENTVRTHSKHIYSKLNVHKRQDIVDIISTM